MIGERLFDNGLQRVFATKAGGTFVNLIIKDRVKEHLLKSSSVPDTPRRSAGGYLAPGLVIGLHRLLAIALKCISFIKEWFHGYFLKSSKDFLFID
jgi:hypothetical protein